MKKRSVLFMLIFSLFISLAAPFAAYAEYLGSAKYSDVVTYINNYAIPSYNYNGYTFIVAEDLRGYGFDVIWTPADSSLRIYRNAQTTITPVKTYRDAPQLVGQDRFSITTTDVKVYMGNYDYQIEGLGGIDGYTLINVDNLAPFGEVSWVPEVNAVKIWIRDGMEIRPVPEDIEYMQQSTAGSDYSFEELKSFLMTNGRYSDGAYILSNYHEGYFYMADYVPGDNYIGLAFSSEYEDSTSSVIMLVYPNDSDCIMSLNYTSDNSDMTCRKRINKSLAANNERIWFDEYSISPGFMDTEDMRDSLRLMGGSGVNVLLTGIDMLLLENGSPVLVNDLGFNIYY